ncbi:hypothetical protein [Pseudomonas aeruginosa]|uniref:hypothetical protein n=1 Tax=Pseudomonas aeruginosa TaxID=287 RepID=UPI00283A977F|nr:hypothetical protein [Pseudomonas aeruginosa]WMU58185.1 hypothetical protein P4B32_18855 [Pseudomonas aeruginosa]
MQQNENFAKQAEQAEAERPEVVAWQYRVTAGPQTGWSLWHPGKGEEFERSYTVERRPLMTVAQHEHIVGDLRAVIAQLRQHKNDYMDSGQETYRALQNEIREREAEIARLDGLVSGRTAERDAALTRVAELEAKLSDPTAVHQWQFSNAWFDDSEEEVLKAGKEGSPTRILYTAPVAPVMVAELEVSSAGQWAIDTSCGRPILTYEGCSVIEGDTAYGVLGLIESRSTPVAQAVQVPQAWLDVQAERRRQITAEGWTPDHDDAHSHGQMARAAACYALAGSSAPNDGTAALLVSLAWPWDEQWWKPSTARRDMVKACALALAEIERLDRAAASQGGPSDA